jgi:hypothetical protein
VGRGGGGLLVVVAVAVVVVLRGPSPACQRWGRRCAVSRWAVKEGREGKEAEGQAAHLQVMGLGEDVVVEGGRPWTMSRCLRSVSRFCSSAGQFSHSQRKEMKCGLSLR